MSNIYKFKFSKSSFELSDDYDRLSDIDKERIADMDVHSYVDFEENDEYSFFIIAESTEIEKYIEILLDNLISFEYKDITTDVLKSKYDIEDKISSIVDPLASGKYSLFMDDLDEWIYDNLDIDIVLDRISDVGMESLKKVEKEFLKNYKSL